jgi:hypothetical protein
MKILKNPIWLWILLVLCILFLLLAVFINTDPTSVTALYRQKFDVLPTATKSDLLSNVDNGDILFFAGTTFGEKSIKWYHKSEWNHCCFVFRDVDETTGLDTPFILESDLGQRHRDGPRVMKLEEKLKLWKGHHIGMWRKYIFADRPNKYDILKIATNYFTGDFGFDKSMYSWFFSGNPESKIFKSLKDPKKIFCSELVASTLQDLNILDKEKIPAWYSPQHFASNVKLIKGHYSIGRYFIY